MTSNVSLYVHVWIVVVVHYLEDENDVVFMITPSQSLPVTTEHGRQPDILAPTSTSLPAWLSDGKVETRG